MPFLYVRCLRWPVRGSVRTAALLFVAINFFATLMTFLRLDERRYRAGVKTLEADRFTRFLAETVGAVFDPLKSRIDFRNQLALTVAGASSIARSVSDEARSARSG